MKHHHPGPFADADALIVSEASESSEKRKTAVPPSARLRLVPGELLMENGPPWTSRAFAVRPVISDPESLLTMRVTWIRLSLAAGPPLSMARHEALIAPASNCGGGGAGIGCESAARCWSACG